MARTVYIDFNQTLVREGTLPLWCVFRLRTGPISQRLRALLDIATLGSAAIASDVVGLPDLASRIGLRAFRGSTPAQVVTWAASALTLNHAALERLGELARPHGKVELRVVSRGSPRVVVEAVLEAPANRDVLREHGVAWCSVEAPVLEEARGRLTGRVSAAPPGKRERLARLPSGVAFLGDRKDLAHLRRLGRQDIDFILIDARNDRTSQ